MASRKSWQPLRYLRIRTSNRSNTKLQCTSSFYNSRTISLDLFIPCVGWKLASVINEAQSFETSIQTECDACAAVRHRLSRCCRHVITELSRVGFYPHASLSRKRQNLAPKCVNDEFKERWANIRKWRDNFESKGGKYNFEIKPAVVRCSHSKMDFSKKSLL